MPRSIAFLAEQLKSRRKKAGLSQEVFADKTGIALSLVRDIERKKANPTLLTLEKIAKYFGVSIAELLDEDDIINNSDYLRASLHQELDTLSLKELKVVAAVLRAASL